MKKKNTFKTGGLREGELGVVEMFVAGLVARPAILLVFYVADRILAALRMHGY